MELNSGLHLGKRERVNYLLIIQRTRLGLLWMRTVRRSPNIFVLLNALFFAPLLKPLTELDLPVHHVFPILTTARNSVLRSAQAVARFLYVNRRVVFLVGGNVGGALIVPHPPFVA